jgi:hypothetical protein
MLKILLISAVLKAFAIITADAGNNESLTTDQSAINSTTAATKIAARAAEQQHHKPSTHHHSEPMNFAKSDLLYLSELPLEQLLKVKKSIDEIQQVSRRAPLHDNQQPDIISEIGVVVEEPARPSVQSTIQSRTMDESGASSKGGFSLFNFAGGKLLQSLIGGGHTEQPRQLQPQAINRKTGWTSSSSGLENPWEQKQSKVQTFFQLSITALAFLAFAGYLLCMIVQAIKAKGTHSR